MFSRVYKSTLTLRNDPTLLTQISNLVTTAIQNGEPSHDKPTLQAGMLVQPQTLPHLRYASEEGSLNLMGLEDLTEPLIRTA